MGSNHDQGLLSNQCKEVYGRGVLPPRA
jgi:hypothetical protein